MSEELQQKLRTQLWTVANNLRGNMSANEFMYFSLGFIFYKYFFLFHNLCSIPQKCTDIKIPENKKVLSFPVLPN